MARSDRYAEGVANALGRLEKRMLHIVYDGLEAVGEGELAEYLDYELQAARRFVRIRSMRKV